MEHIKIRDLSKIFNVRSPRKARSNVRRSDGSSARLPLSALPRRVQRQRIVFIQQIGVVNWRSRKNSVFTDT